MQRYSGSPAIDQMPAVTGVYRLLARIWMREVDDLLLRTLAEPALAKLFIDAGGTLPAENDVTILEPLEVDFCQLFVGPSQHIPTCQSVWESGRFQAAAQDSMNEFIAALGYRVADLPTGIMHDHLSVQLDFMGHLTSLCATSEPTVLNDLVGIGRRFFRRHLSWQEPLFDAAERKAQTPFYRSAIRMTADFLQSERLIWAEAQ